MTLAWYEVLEAEFPSIEWRAPFKVIRTDGEFGYACRICIARNGLHGRDIPELPDDPNEVIRHIAEEHPHSDRYRTLIDEAVAEAVAEASAKLRGAGT